ncbi:MAG: hypothetical protein GVY14_05040 [Spirochaetes bacterium]|jgi:hypothetical protein|nr:hypothetical protein [Spirochaetota bacterium]
MLLYLVASAPLFTLTLCLFYRVTHPGPSAVMFFHGVLSAVPMLALWWALGTVVEPAYTPGGLYLRELTLRMLHPLLPGVALFFLFERRIWRERGHVAVIALAAFLAGVYFVQSLMDVLRIPHYYSPYVAFLLPTLRIGLIAAVPALIGAASREPRPLRLLLGSGAVLLPAAFAGAALLDHLNYALLAYLATALLVALAALMHVLLLGSYYPRRTQAFSWNARRGDRRASYEPIDDGATGNGGDGEPDRDRPVTEISEHAAPDA